MVRRKWLFGVPSTQSTGTHFVHRMFWKQIYRRDLALTVMALILGTSDYYYCYYYLMIPARPPVGSMVLDVVRVEGAIVAVGMVIQIVM